MPEREAAAPLPLRDVLHASTMAIACLAAYWVTKHGLASFVGRADDFLGGMWAAVTTAIVFREDHRDSLSAGLARLIGTSVSFVLCLCYLLAFSPSPIGMAALLTVGTVAMTVLRRRDDIITTAVTTIVVMMVAAERPETAWHEPLLRLVDTLVGIGVGVACRLIMAGLLDLPKASRGR